MVEFVAVTYEGPSRSYSTEHEGEWYEFAKGAPISTPEPLAERLLDVPGHDFEVGDEVEKAERFLEEILDSGSGSGEGSGDGDDPERVNATSPYGEPEA